MRKNIKRSGPAFLLWVAAVMASSPAAGHGTLVYPMSRVYRVYQSNPENPSFELARSAIAIDGTGPYYSWNEISQNIPEAVQAGLPPGFDYSPWVRDGELASGGRAGRDDSAVAIWVSTRSTRSGRRRLSPRGRRSRSIFMPRRRTIPVSGMSG